MWSHPVGYHVRAQLDLQDKITKKKYFNIIEESENNWTEDFLLNVSSHSAT